MINVEFLEQLAKRYQTNLFPNIVREYFQHLFLSELYQSEGAEKLLFKGGTALRILYGSPRFSEDLDFSLVGLSVNLGQTFVERELMRVLAEMERIGIKVEIGAKSGATSGGYFGVAAFQMADYQPVEVTLNVSMRGIKKIRGEVDIIAGDFVPTYSIVHLPQKEIVEEKVFGALRERKKPRDFYDFYFMIRKGMFSSEQKKRISKIKDAILADAKKVDFRGELRVFLPANQQAIIRDFAHTLEAEIGRQMG